MDATTTPSEPPKTLREHVRAWWLGQPGIDPHATEPWTDPSNGQRYLRTINGWVRCCDDHNEEG